MTSNSRVPQATRNILTAVADRTHTSIKDLPQIQDVIDAESLNQLVRAASTKGTTLTVQFVYAGFLVEVDQDASVTLTDLPDPN